MGRQSRGQMEQDIERLEMLLGAALVERDAAITSSNIYHHIATEALGELAVQQKVKVYRDRLTQIRSNQGGSDNEDSD